MSKHKLNLAIACLMLDLFSGRTDRILIDDGFGRISNRESDDPLTAAIVAEEHLTHVTGYGVFPLLDDGSVNFAAVDFDDKHGNKQRQIRHEAVQVTDALRRAGLHPLAEISQSGKGIHLWLFFIKPLKAFLIRRLLRGLLDQLGLGSLEIYPRQDTVTKKQPYGNAIRLPLFKKSHFVDIDEDWRRLTPLDALRSVKRVSRKHVIRAARILEIPLSPTKTKPNRATQSSTSGLLHYVQALIDDSNSTLSRRWRGDSAGLNDDSNSGLAMSIATCLVAGFVPTPEIEATLRHWCALHCPAKGERDDWIERTIERAYEFIQQSYLSRRRVSTNNPSDGGTSAAIAREIRRSRRRNRNNK